MARTKNSGDANERLREHTIPAKTPRDATPRRRTLPQPVARVSSASVCSTFAPRYASASADSHIPTHNGSTD